MQQTTNPVPLSHCGLVTPYGVMNLGQHVFQTMANDIYSLPEPYVMSFCGIHIITDLKSVKAKFIEKNGVVEVSQGHVNMVECCCNINYISRPVTSRWVIEMVYFFFFLCCILIWIVHVYVRMNIIYDSCKTCIWHAHICVYICICMYTYMYVQILSWLPPYTL